MTDEDRIRKCAHRIWEEEGRPNGRHEEHRHRAMQEMQVERKSNIPGRPSAAEDIPSQTGGGFDAGVPDRMGVDELAVGENLPGPDDNLPAGTLCKRLLP